MKRLTKNYTTAQNREIKFNYSIYGEEISKTTGARVRVWGKRYATHTKFYAIVDINGFKEYNYSCLNYELKENTIEIIIKDILNDEED